jgi:hypothetical protein
MTPHSLNELASEWQRFILALPHSQAADTGKHVPGQHTVYLFQVLIVHADREILFHYIGETARDPRVRLSEHISEFVRCSVKTKHGKSDLYDPRYMHGALGFKFKLIALEGGFETRKLAQVREAETANAYKQMYPGFMISNQSRGRGKDTRPRQERTKMSV